MKKMAENRGYPTPKNAPRQDARGALVHDLNIQPSFFHMKPIFLGYTPFFSVKRPRSPNGSKKF